MADPDRMQGVDDVTALLDDVTLECETFSNDVDRQHRCQCLLEAAILTGNVTAVREILDHPHISKYVDKYGRPNGRDRCPAFLSLRMDSSNVLKLLVEEEGIDAFMNRGCGPSDDGDDRGRSYGVHGTVFETACKDGRLQCATYLLSRLTQKPSRDASHDEVAISHASNDVRHTSSESLEKSRDAFYDDDVKSKRLLFYGAMAGIENDRQDVLKLILKTGSMDINAIIDHDIGTMLHVAAECNSVHCAKVLLSWSSSGHRPEVDLEKVATDRQQTPLMKAAEHNSVEVLEMLLAAGADINRQTNECSSALIISCHFGHRQCVETLLAHGANPHLKNRWGFTALYMGTDTPAILERMLREPVDVNEHCGDRQEVPLHLATVIGSVDAINSLLDRGAEVNRRTIYNENALWLAIWKEHTDAARVLIQNNIDVDAESNGWQVYIWYYLPIEVALGLRNYDVVRMLLTVGCSLHNSRYFRSESEKGPLADVGMPWVRLRSEAFDFVREDQFRFTWLKEWLTSPSSLKNSCRRSLRRILRTPIREKVRRLPLPTVIQSYLMMNDL